MTTSLFLIVQSFIFVYMYSIYSTLFCFFFLVTSLDSIFYEWRHHVRLPYHSMRLPWYGMRLLWYGMRLLWYGMRLLWYDMMLPYHGIVWDCCTMVGYCHNGVMAKLQSVTISVETWSKVRERARFHQYLAEIVNASEIYFSAPSQKILKKVILREISV